MSEKEFVLFGSIAISAQARVVTATASTIGAPEATGSYQTTVYGNIMVPSPGCDPFPIRNANIIAGLTR